MKVLSSVFTTAIVAVLASNASAVMVEQVFPMSSPSNPGVHLQGCLEASDRTDVYGCAGVTQADLDAAITMTDRPYTQLDGMVRCCRNSGSDSQQNWSGSDSFQAFGDNNRMTGDPPVPHPDFEGMRAQNGGEAWDRYGLVVSDGWMEELKGPIVEAWYDLHLRFNGSFIEGNSGIEAHPLLRDVRGVLGGRGNSLVGAADVQPANHGEASFRHFSTDLTGTSVSWGNDPDARTYGPVQGVDYDPNITDQSVIVLDSPDATQFKQVRVNITNIAKAWQAGTIPNNGIVLQGINAGNTITDPVTGEEVFLDFAIEGHEHRLNPGFYFHGADASLTGDDADFGERLWVADTELRGQARFFPSLHVIVPEPATFGLLALGGLVMLRRNRSH